MSKITYTSTGGLCIIKVYQKQEKGADYGTTIDEIDEEEYERRRRALIMRKRQEKIRQMKIRKLTRLVIMAVLLVTVVVAAGTGITKLAGGGDKKEPSKITQEVQADTEKGETETSAAKQPVMSSSDIEKLASDTTIFGWQQDETGKWYRNADGTFYVKWLERNRWCAVLF